MSEHLCWSGVGGVHLNDLLPLPYTEEALAHVVARVAEIQDTLGRELLVENVSSYLGFADATIPEWEFVAAVAQQTGCKLLLDVNNIHVNAVNHGFDPDRYLAAIPAEAVAEIHLAGFDAAGPCLIDTHGARGRARRVGALRARDRALRTAADADRVGCRHSRVRRAAGRGGARAIDTRPDPCARCADVAAATSPTRCSRRTSDSARVSRSARRRTERRERMAIYRRAVFANYRNALARDLPGRGTARRRAVLRRGGRRLRARASVDAAATSTCMAIVRRVPRDVSTRARPCPTCPTSRASNGRSTRRTARADVFATARRGPCGACRRRRRSGCPARGCGSRRTADWSRRTIRFCASGR